ncbi:ABC-type transporter Mla subunit MlaD [Evansella vedderi]|uniref:ABC-type transporter Mla subunit MlaD n=1 Tax=Evansella vedderi TaxID=38282 RepID=A0ABT9ZSV3_9BACI|nr:hypothetical protein [Evansella vedderi]MDQ0254302.1 ABC-type transporter Mla subunit MlaD [Evansella vedderi]
MKNIFFKAVPGLFQRRKNIKNDNQQFYYDNKVMDSINKLQKANHKLVDKITSLNESTNKVGEKTEDLFQIIDNIKYDHAEEMEKVLGQMSELNENQKLEMEDMKNYLKNLQRKQQEKMGRQLGDLRTNLQQLKELQDKNQINSTNDHEILTVLLEGLYDRLDTLQQNHKKEIGRIATKLGETNKDIQEKSNIQLEYSKTHSDLLYKLREQHFDYESNQLEEQKKLVDIIEELRGDMKKLEKLMEVSEGLMKTK